MDSGLLQNATYETILLTQTGDSIPVVKSVPNYVVTAAYMPIRLQATHWRTVCSRAVQMWMKVNLGAPGPCRDLLCPGMGQDSEQDPLEGVQHEGHGEELPAPSLVLISFCNYYN